MDAREIAKERCEKLIKLAGAEKDARLSKRYITLARKIAMRHQISLGSKSFCRRCGTVWVPGRTLRVRRSKGATLYICLACNYVRRFPISGKNSR
ncbi:ribonuclease P [Candidatus Micrarchaeota archaeon CG08_land_8_20_14_0_20_59_11]|nr:MAG: ribonuclease P [Candidatus Micrarchaeota archaeon CG08_land_8_20_14_0_20_59_11]